MKYFFTSDLHLGHANIIRYCKRPWIQEGDVITIDGKEQEKKIRKKEKWISKEIAQQRVKEMDEVIIKNWNERVKEDDVVFVIGDFCFKNSPGGKLGEGEQNTAKYYEEQLNGKMILIQGNHDSSNSAKTIIQNMTIKHGGIRIFMTHDPKFARKDFRLNLCGHIHNHWKIKGNIYNVGVDVNNFMPVDINEILGFFKRGKYKRHDKGEVINGSKLTLLPKMTTNKGVK